MNHNVFINMTYLLIDMEASLPGWTNVQRHNGHEVVLSTCGDQAAAQPHLKTHSRVNMPSLFDDDSIVIENGTTVEVFILAGDISIADSDDIIYAIAKGAWCEKDEKPSAEQLNAVTNKIEITELSLTEVHTMLENNQEYWGEGA